MEVLPQNSYLLNSIMQNFFKDNSNLSQSKPIISNSPIFNKSSNSSTPLNSPPSLSSISSPVSSSPPTTSISSSQKRSSSSPLSPVILPSNWKKCCNISRCLLCSNGTPRCLCMNHPSWTLILRVVFYALSQLHPDKEFFNLKKEVYVYLNDHWEILSPNQKQSNNWRRQVQDALSHSRFFRSGRHTLRCNGYWQLKLLCNPWNYINSKQFETIRIDESSTLANDFNDFNQFPNNNLNNNNNINNSNNEIAWRIQSNSSPIKSFSKLNQSIKNYQHNNSTTTMNINQLLCNSNNNNSNITDNSADDVYDFDISSPLSSNGNSPNDSDGIPSNPSSPLISLGGNKLFNNNNDIKLSALTTLSNFSLISKLANNNNNSNNNNNNNVGYNSQPIQKLQFNQNLLNNNTDTNNEKANKFNIDFITI